MKNKIEELLKSDEKISFGKIAEELGVPFIDVLRNAPAPKVRKYDVEKIDDLFETLRSWEKVFLLVVTPNFVLEIKDKFPKGAYGYGYLNFHDSSSSIGGHLTASAIKEIYLVRDVMYNRESCSIKFFDKNGKEIFAVYVPRDEKREFLKECIESFNNIV